MAKTDDEKLARRGSFACRKDIETVLTMLDKSGAVKYPYMTNPKLQQAIKAELGHTWYYNDITTAVNDSPVAGGVEILWRHTGNGPEREFCAATTAPDTHRLWTNDLQRPLNELKRRLRNRHLPAANAKRVAVTDIKAVRGQNDSVAALTQALEESIKNNADLIKADSKAKKAEADKAKAEAELAAYKAEAAKKIAELEARAKAAEAKATKAENGTK